MVTYQCVAKHLCGMTTTPITKPQHHCTLCCGPFHTALLSGVLWLERDRSTILIRKVDCSRHAQSLWVSATAAMCFACIEKLDSGLPTEQLGAVSPICLVALPLELDTPTVLSSPGVGLPPLAEILDDTDHFRVFTHSTGNKRYECLWCHHQCSHVTKLLAHVNKVKNKGVKLCSEVIPDKHKKRYWALWERKEGRKTSKNGECSNWSHIIIICIESK